MSGIRVYSRVFTTEEWAATVAEMDAKIARRKGEGGLVLTDLTTAHQSEWDTLIGALVEHGHIHPSDEMDARESAWLKGFHCPNCSSSSGFARRDPHPKWKGIRATCSYHCGTAQVMRALGLQVDLVDNWPDRPSDADHIAERSIVLTKASSIAVRPVKWLWAGRLAEGTLALLGGREGIGKSTIAYTLAADYTRGRLPGTDHGKPRAVIVAATEDSWEHTINPRLMAAGADLDLVYRVDVTTPDGVAADVLTLPRDIRALEEQIHEVDAGIILLDPLISRLDKKLDAHKDPEVHWALEPLVAIAERARVVVLGLIHVNKSASTDPLTLLMGSRAFAAVARAVLFVMKDPDNEEVRLLGQPKNNLGRADLPTLTLRIESAHVADTEEGPVWTGRVVWQEDLDQSISDVLASAADGSEVRTAVGEAADWLHDWLTTLGGTDASADIKTAARKAGHSESAVQRARRKLKLTSESEGHPRRTFWSLPGTQPSRVKPGESETTDMTDTTAGQSPNGVSVVSVVSNISKSRAREAETWPPGSIGAETNGEDAS